MDLPPHRTLAKHTSKEADLEPEKFEDHYEEALTELINAKRSGKTVGPKARPKGENVVDLMDALSRAEAAARLRRPRKERRARPRRARRK